MNITEINQEVINTIRRHLVKTDYQIWLFGSQAEGTEHETSDLDVGIIGREPIPTEKLIRIKQEVEAIPTLRSIDIVDLLTTSEKFRSRALRSAKQLD